MNTCYIIGAGECFGLDFTPNPGDYVIAADGGYRYLCERGYRADLVLGDFDSLSAPPAHENVLRLQPEKDDTDTFSALKEGLKRGYRRFILYCCTGGRLDHTVANLQSLQFLAEQGAVGYLVGQKSVATALKNGSLSLPATLRGTVSVFAAGTVAEGVTLKGLKYPLTDYLMCNDFPIGVSNELTGNPAEISVKNGSLLIFLPLEYL